MKFIDPSNDTATINKCIVVLKKYLEVTRNPLFLSPDSGVSGVCETKKQGE
jgi:hypothetical protein